MEYTAQYFNTLTNIFAQSQFRFSFLALIALLVFFKGLKVIFSDGIALKGFYLRSKKERISFPNFVLNNAHNIGIYLLVLFVTAFSAYLVYFSSQGLKSLEQTNKTSHSVKK